MKYQIYHRTFHLPEINFNFSISYVECIILEWPHFESETTIPHAAVLLDLRCATRRERYLLYYFIAAIWNSCEHRFQFNEPTESVATEMIHDTRKDRWGRMHVYIHTYIRHLHACFIVFPVRDRLSNNINFQGMCVRDSLPDPVGGETKAGVEAALINETPECIVSKHWHMCHHNNWQLFIVSCLQQFENDVSYFINRSSDYCTFTSLFLFCIYETIPIIIK